MSGARDSAGVAWSGRELLAQPWAGDDGSAPPGLLAAIQGCTAAPADVDALVRLTACLLDSRLLVPVVARPVGGEAAVSSLRDGDRGAEMSVPILGVPGGPTTLPAFTGVQALSAWDARARPVPAATPTVAAAALAEGCTCVVLDPHVPGLRLLRPVLLDLAEGRSWTPAWQVPQVEAALVDLLREQALGVESLTAQPCDEPTGLDLGVGLPRGWSSERVSAVCQELAAELAADPRVAERVTALRLVLHASS